jgi:hypothetical protein
MAVAEMSSTSLSAPRPATATRRRATPRLTPELAGVVVLSAACLAAFLIWPILPTFDLAHEWLWAHDLVHGRLPEIGSFRSPTPHPLALLVMLPLGPLGNTGQRASVAIVMASYVFLVAGTFALSRACFSRTVAWVAAIVVVSRLNYAALAIRAYVDVPYLALVVWAGALEARTPRRGGPVWVLLVLAGLLRPEAWVLSGLYGLWIILGDARGWRDWHAWLRPALWTALAPLIWMAGDLLLTGNPLFSLTYTSGSAAELHHSAPLLTLPRLVVHSLDTIIHWPAIVAGVIGLIAALAVAPRRAAIPGILLGSGLLTFALIVAAGLAAIARYLSVAGLMLLVFAGFAVAGWSLLQPGRWRTQWMALAAVGVVLGGGWTVVRLNPGSINYDLTTRLDAERGVRAILARAPVRAALRCGPVTVPNQKLLAEVRIALGGARAHDVLARTDPNPDAQRRMHRGVALVIASPRIIFHVAYSPFDQKTDPATAIGPPPAFDRIAHNRWFAAYARC